MPADAGQRDGGEGGGVRGVHEAFDEELDRQTIHCTSGSCRRHWMLVGVELLDLRAECIHRRRRRRVSLGEAARGAPADAEPNFLLYFDLCKELRSDILQLTVCSTALIDLHIIMRIEVEV